jgi:hypothetical protein
MRDAVVEVTDVAAGRRATSDGEELRAALAGNRRAV